MELLMTCLGAFLALTSRHTEASVSRAEAAEHGAPKEFPLCGDALCNSIYPGSWCRASNGVCQWADVPCSCQATSSPPTASTTSTVTTAGSITSLNPQPTTSQASQLCGNELCQSIRPDSWCRASNGVCQWTNDPCRCAATTSETSTTSAIVTLPTTSRRAPDEERYVKTDKSLYVWNTGDLSRAWWEWTSEHIHLLVSVCRVHGFKRAIVFIGSLEWDWQIFQGSMLPHQENFVRLFAGLRAAGVMPYACFYLNDAPNDLSNWQRAADVVSAVHQFNQAFPDSRLEGIDGDQEPQSISSEYLQMNEVMRDRREKLGSEITLTASLKPGWLSRTYQGQAMLQAALTSLDVGMIMAYRSSAELSQAWGDQALELAAAAGKGMCVAIETSPRAPETDSFWEMASTDKTRFLQMVVDMDEHYRSGAYSSMFRGLVIHDYEGFFEAMYGMKAPDYPGRVVTTLYA